MAAPSALEADSPAELVPSFFQNPFLSNVEVSPGGTRIAALLGAGGQERIIVRPLARGQAVPIVGLPDSLARFRWLRWVTDESLLFSVEEPIDPRSPPPRARRTRLYSVNADGTRQEHLGRNWEKFLLMGRGQFQFEDDLIDVLEHDPKRVLLAIRKPTDAYPGVYAVEVKGGGAKLVVAPQHGVVDWYADREGVVRAGLGYEHAEYKLVARRSADDDFVELAAWRHGGDSLHFEGFGSDSDTIYVSKASAEGYGTLWEFDLKAGAPRSEVLSTEGYDVPSWLEYSGSPPRPSAVVYHREGPRRHFLDDEARELQELLDRSLPDTFNRIVSESRDRSVAIVYASSDTVAPAYYTFRPLEKKVIHLADVYPGLEKDELAAMEPVSYPARDGRTIPAYLTRPHGAGDAPAPAVVLPHGGPSARDYRRFDPVVQYLAALGFAVLQPNFRGSTGYGDDHRSAGDRQWGLAMQDDITDGVKWLVDSGYADPGRICIFGASYGGYAALMGLVKTPELFRCGASYAGPSDLVMLLNHFKGYLFAEANVPLVGGTSKDREQLRATSPLQNAAKFRAPVFLAHGEDDERVDVVHTHKLAKQLKKTGKPHEVMILEHEAHSIRDERYRLELYRRLGEFLLANTRPVAGD